MARKKSTQIEFDEGTKDKNLELALNSIEKEYGTGTIMRLGDDSVKMVPTISTGALSLDVALGIGGLPRGRIVEIYGPESSGKTTVCMHVIANAQKAGGMAAFIDSEHALDPIYAQKIGINIRDLLVSQPDCGEDALSIAETLVRSNALDVLVIDSVAALVPRAEIEGSMGDSHVGLQARLMSQALRKLTGAVSKSKTCLIFTNQIREKIGVMFGNPETTTGGNALKFYSSIRMEIRRQEPIKESNGNIIGNRTRVKVVKNKMAPPFKIAMFDIMYSEGINRAASILEVATDLDIVAKRGSWLSYKDEHIGQGREQAKETLQTNPDLQQEIVEQIYDLTGIRKKKVEEADTAAEPDDAEVVTS